MGSDEGAHRDEVSSPPADGSWGNEERFRHFVDSVVDYAIFGLDPQGIIETWNSGAERLKGYHEDEIVGRHFSVFYPEERRREGLPERLLTEAAESGSVHDAGWRVRNDGTRFWADVTITALRDNAGDLRGFVKVTRDLTEQRANEESLRRSEEHLRLLVENVVDYAIFVLDPQGIIETWNAGAERLKGYDEDEIVGRHFSVFYTPQDRAAGLPAALLARARKEGNVAHAGWRVRKDGTRFWGSVAITALRNTEGQLVGFAKVTRDMTERHEQEMRLRETLEREQEAAEKLARLNRARRDFIAAVVHDVRSPLVAIRGFADILSREAPEDEHGEYAAHIARNAEHVLKLVEQLLEFSRLETGVVSIRPEDLVLRDHVDGAVESLVSVTSNHEISIEIGPDVHVYADPVALDRVLTNLLSNAAKFSPAGSSIHVGSERTENATIISVTDEGEGIPPDEQEAIFDRFHRSSAAHDQTGVGIGLSIVREYSELHGGRVWVESEPGMGATFRVALPHPSSD